MSVRSNVIAIKHDERRLFASLGTVSLSNHCPYFPNHLDRGLVARACRQRAVRFSRMLLSELKRVNTRSQEISQFDGSLAGSRRERR